VLRRALAALWRDGGQFNPLQAVTMAFDHPLAPFAQIGQQVKAIDDLDGVRRSLMDGPGVFPGAVPRDDLDTRTLFEPVG
jgi:hypothetical protein